MPRKHKPVHPGEILQEEFLTPLGISKYRLAKETGMPADRVGKITHGERAITGDTAMRLARFFGTTPQFWMNLQVRYDLDRTEEERGREIQRTVKPWRAA